MSDWVTDLHDQQKADGETIRAFYELVGNLTGSPLVEVLRRYQDMIAGAIAEAPCEQCDRVELVEDVIIGPASGWIGAKHFLVKGAKATVRAVKLNQLGYRVGLVFDDDSRIDQDGNRHPTVPEARGVYFLPASAVRKLEEP